MTEVEVQKPAVSPNGSIDFGEHEVAVDAELDLAGVVLDPVAVAVVDGTPVDGAGERCPVGDRLRHRAGAGRRRRWRCRVGDGGGDAVGGEQGAGVCERAHLEGVLAVADAGGGPEAGGVTERDQLISVSTRVPSTRNSIVPGSSSTPSPLRS